MLVLATIQYFFCLNDFDQSTAQMCVSLVSFLPPKKWTGKTCLRALQLIVCLDLCFYPFLPEFTCKEFSFINYFNLLFEERKNRRGLNNKCWHKVGKIFVGVRFCSTKTIPTQLVFMQCVQRGFFLHIIYQINHAALITHLVLVWLTKEYKVCLYTPTRTPRLSRLKSQVLKPTFLS